MGKIGLLLLLSLLPVTAFSDCRISWTPPTTYANSLEPLPSGELNGYNFKISVSDGSISDILDSTNEAAASAYDVPSLGETSAGIYYTFAVKATGKTAVTSDPDKLNFVIRSGICSEYVDTGNPRQIGAPTGLTVETI